MSLCFLYSLSEKSFVILSSFHLSVSSFSNLPISNIEQLGNYQHTATLTNRQVQQFPTLSNLKHLSFGRSANCAILHFYEPREQRITGSANAQISRSLDLGIHYHHFEKKKHQTPPLHYFGEFQIFPTIYG